MRKQIYKLTIKISLTKLMQKNKEKTAPFQAYLTHFLSFTIVCRRRFSSKTVLICQPREYRTLSTNGHCVVVHAEAIFERNVGLLLDSFIFCLKVSLDVFPRH